MNLRVLRALSLHLVLLFFLLHCSFSDDRLLFSSGHRAYCFLTALKFVLHFWLNKETLMALCSNFKFCTENLIGLGSGISCNHRQLFSLRPNQHLLLYVVGYCISFRCETIWRPNMLMPTGVIKCVLFFLHHLIFTIINYTRCASLSKRIIMLVL